jgi:FkbM family methyltransferase
MKDVPMTRKNRANTKKLVPSKIMAHASRSAGYLPHTPAEWVQLGKQQLDQKKLTEAKESFEEALSLEVDNVKATLGLASIAKSQGEVDKSIELLDAIKHQEHEALAIHRLLGAIYTDLRQHEKARHHLEEAAQYGSKDPTLLWEKARFHQQVYEYQAAEENILELAALRPKSVEMWNSLGNINRDLGRLEKAEECYKKAIAFGDSPIPFSNLLTLFHYDPKKSREDITRLAKSWQEKFAAHIPKLAYSASTEPDKVLKIGMLSDGFHRHPVGKMIVRCLEYINSDEIKFFFYSTRDVEDDISYRLKKCAEKYININNISDKQLIEKVQADSVDILFDLSGHNTGTRMVAVAQKPAPIIVKWVGGLINTTGVIAIDYLLSDAVETPEGVDDQYVEKLIRLPDDYIVFDPPVSKPAVVELPAIKNGYITLGCFNNPTKINDALISEWALLLNQLEEAKLFLKGRPYTNEEFCERLYLAFEKHGLQRDRLVIEGPGSNYELLNAYNKVDIALDSWPYSGGLTTCEALMMGVPVVTLPGPTFAGRHSASHLVNAGMPELVVNNWDDYRARVLELASDVESLSTIRRSLRQILLQSPVCDGPRFAKHFTKAMRAVWQRYCEEKTPEALTFNTAGELWFEDDKKNLNVQVVEKPASIDGFQWELKGKLVVLDNSARLIKTGAAEKLIQTNAFTILAFDAASNVRNPASYAGHEHIQLFQQASLGDGQPAKLNACLEPALSSSLTPLQDNQLPERHRKGAKVLAQLPINTIALDSINGLASLDWLILDELSDAASILEHGKNALKDTLLIQVGVAFQPTHERQPSLAELQHWASRNGFRFYRFNNEQHASYLPETVPEEKRQATELQSADVLFLPSHERMAELNNNQRTKLAFLLHTVYGIKDMAYELLKDVDEEKAAEYLVIADAFKLSQNRDKSSAKPKPAKVETETETVSSDIDSLLDGTEAPSSVFETPEQPPAASQTVASKSHESKARNLWELDDPIHVVDIGANPIDGTPPYAELLKRGFVKLVGFEPQKDALQKLLAMKGPNETYLPHAVGAGEKTQLYICQASGMTSTLKPNNKVLDHFQGYPIWGKVKSVEEIDTVRLDDVAEIGKVDWLKIDIQGGELNVFKNGEEKLKDTLVIQTEVNFIQLYENQPLFAEVDQWMRAHGFMLHTLLEQRKRLYAPMKINGGIHQGINQLTTADAVYVRDINLSQFTTAQRKKIAFILSKAYGSHDFAYRLLMNEKSFNKKDFFKKIVGKQINAISVD